MTGRKTGYRRPFDMRSAKRLNRAQVNEALVCIWREHDYRLSSSYAGKQPFGLSKNEAAKNFLRREIYALGLALMRSPPSWDVSELVASGRARRTTRIDVLEDRIFHALFMGVYDEDTLIKRQERWSMTRELEYAHRHGVPPEYLCGFLYQSGGRSGLLEKLKAGSK